MSEQDPAIIVFPDYERLKDEVEKMKTELSMLMMERDELRFVICKNIATKYMLLLGGLEYRVYKAQCAALRLKRKIELIQMRKNRQEKVILSEIEKALDEEFAEYRQRLEEQLGLMNDALERSKAKALTEAESRELKRMYRAVVKMLHPDLNPNASAEQVRLLENAVEAYKNGDLATLRAICEMVETGDLPAEGEDHALARLMEARARLENALKAVRLRIGEIKSEFPYTVRELLQDEAAIARRKEGLTEQLQEYNEAIERYKERLDEMLRERNG